ncbi:MAG TPA: metal-dependent hydrolase [Gemmatimonadaceae bacterium]|nr:metal-dependent hydrolase [Gemmatimonadaceae bacterium]
MDNVCHTLIGGALARAGLDRRTPLATATMMIGANFPDVDVVAVLSGNDLAVRRGITHGVPAHFILPFVLTAIMLAWDRWVRRRRDPSLPAAVPREILALSAISNATHPFFDWLNSYGMRWLMPMRDEWFYGDSLFIADPWLWIVLGAGYVMSGRRANPRPARIAVVLCAAYVILMMLETGLVRDKVQREFGAGETSRALMVSAVAANPFARQIVMVRGGEYRTGRWSLFTGEVGWEETIPINREAPAVATALKDPSVRPFMHWARFPFFIVRPTGDGRTLVHIADARYTGSEGGGWASTSVTVTP